MSPIASGRRSRTRDKIAVCVLAAIGVSVLIFLALQMHKPAAINQQNAAMQFHLLHYVAMEQKVRNALPPGTPSKDVIEYLAYRRVEFSLGEQTIRATVTQIPARFQRIHERELFVFHFDDNMKLQSIDVQKVPKIF